MASEAEVVLDKAIFSGFKSNDGFNISCVDNENWISNQNYLIQIKLLQ